MSALFHSYLCGRNAAEWLIKMKEAKIDTAVYLNFFNRPNTFKYVFEAVKKVRPTKLFLSCDGARKGNQDDVKKIAACKKIAEDVDWKCEIFKNYSEENLGCGMRMNSGITWAFNHVDRLIILEDDCVPSEDFFYFCQELLEKYKYDHRIYMINAMNHLIEYKETPSSYFFGPGCCWGWATWKRAWEQMDFEMSFLKDDYSMKCVERKYPFYRDVRKIGAQRRAVLDSGKNLSSWTYQSGMAAALNSQMAIVPSVNLITNIGLTADSAHAVNNVNKLAKKTRAYFNAPIIPMSFPLRHPEFIVEDWNYYDLVQKKFKPTLASTLEGYCRRMIFADKGERAEMARKLLKRLLNRGISGKC